MMNSAIKSVRKSQDARRQKHHYYRKQNKLERDGYLFTSKGGAFQVNITEKYFAQMLEKLRPLLSQPNGSAKSQLCAVYKDSPTSLIEVFLSMAIKLGIVSECADDFFILV